MVLRLQGYNAMTTTDDVTDVLVLVTYSILFLLLLIFSFFSIRFSCVSCVRLSLDCTVACRGRARVAMDRFPFPVVRQGRNGVRARRF